MGVMACDIPGCDNIMSRYYIEGIGYVCSSCMDKIREKLGDVRLPKEQLIEKVKAILIEEPICIEDLVRDNEQDT